MKPLVIDYLKHHSFKQLEDDHGVCFRLGSLYDKASLNYDQLMVKNGDPLAEQCRGLIIRPKQWIEFNPTLHSNTDRLVQQTTHSIVGECEVLAWPMNRFYNACDPKAADIDWSDSSIRIYEKLDGTMMVVYWDALHKRWHAGTRAVPEANLPIKAGHIEIGDMTFSDLFFEALRKTREALSGEPINWETGDFDKVVHLNKELTYVFELTSPFNRVVVKYDEPRVTLLAARHTASGDEVPIESLRLQHVQRPKVWNLKSIEELITFVDSADPSMLEGAVVCDSHFRRVKVKNKTWVLSSRAKDLVTVSRRSAIEAIITGKIDDVIPLVERDIAAELNRMQVAMVQCFKQIDIAFAEHKKIADGSRKQFAMAVTASDRWSSPYFAMWEGKAGSVMEWARTLADNNKLTPGILDTILARLAL